MAFFVK